jgi:hypothetical protein
MVDSDVTTASANAGQHCPVKTHLACLSRRITFVDLQCACAWSPLVMGSRAQWATTAVVMTVAASNTCGSIRVALAMGNTASVADAIMAVARGKRKQPSPIATCCQLPLPDRSCLPWVNFGLSPPLPAPLQTPVSCLPRMKKEVKS